METTVSPRSCGFQPAVPSWGHDPSRKGGPFESLRVSGDGVCALGANGRRFHVCHPEPCGVDGGRWRANGDHGFPSKLRVSTRSTVWGHDPAPKAPPFESLRVSGDGVCALGANGRRFHVCHPEPCGVDGGRWRANGDHGFPSKLRVSTRSTVWGHDPSPKGPPFESLRVSGDGVCALGANGRRFHVCHPEPSGQKEGGGAPTGKGGA